MTYYKELRGKHGQNKWRNTMYRYDVECTCNYIEAEHFSIMAGMNKDKKNIRKNTEQQKVQT